jgi:hypothetical protein
MIEYLGNIQSLRTCPVLYFINKLNYIYVGVTDNHPVVRWASHLCNNGSFFQNLQHADLDAHARSSKIRFWAYSCEAIVQYVKPLEQRQALQLVEHFVHIEACLNKIGTGSELTLISDTLRTAPRKYNFPQARTIAKEIFIDFNKRFDGIF